MASSGPPFFDIEESQLTSLKDKVILITGGSSGIGFATAKLCLKVGAKVVVGDVNNWPGDSSDDLVFQHVDVRDWKSQAALFKKAVEAFGRVDHVYANAGILSVDNFVDDKFDDNGELLPPDMKTMDINLNGPIYTCKFGIHYLKKNKEGGSVVITASASSFVPFYLTDYGTSKHAVLGLMRGLEANLAHSDPDHSNIRVNCVTPLWTATGIVPEDLVKEKMGIVAQPPEAVAKSAMLLMADKERRGQTIYSRQGRFKDMEGLLLGVAVGAMETGEGDGPRETGDMRKIWRELRDKSKRGGSV